ncbi:MAG: winged helix-turn-helix transcriptional regulator [Rhodospirillaceae bacterium]|nr:winged helix-turn-helix transcriptional regulator [Rhodospirillaceae bacterium]
MPDALSATFAALADPTRRAILARLAQGDATVMELAEPFALTQPAISKHLKVLERAGMITRGRMAQTRPCRLDTARLREAAQWIEAYRHLWDASFDRLAAYLDRIQPCDPEGR